MTPAADPRLAELTEALERVQPWKDGKPVPWHWWGEHVEPDGARITGHRRGSSRQFAVALLPVRTATTEAVALAAAIKALVRAVRKAEPFASRDPILGPAIAAALAATGGER